MEDEIHSNRYSTFYNPIVLNMIKDYNTLTGTTLIPILEKSGVEYIELDNEQIIYTSKWFVLKKPFGDFVSITALYVAPEYRRLGYAKYVLNTLVKSYGRVFIHTPVVNGSFVRALHLKQQVSNLKNYKEYVLF